MTQGGAHTNAPDYNYCNYLITMGSSMGANWATAGGPVRGVMGAIERGMKAIVVDPRAGIEASMGEWVPIRPGSELAFELALLNVMIYEIGLARLDVPFLKRRSNAPYLVGAGERFYRDPATKKPMIWDPTDSKAKVFDDPSIKDYALEGEFQVGGQTVQPGFAHGQSRDEDLHARNGRSRSRRSRRRRSGASPTSSWRRRRSAAPSGSMAWSSRCARR